MKNLISFIIFISLPMLYIGQNNLVVNCSFENYTIDCDASNINFGGIRWGYCANWSSPDALTPDYFNECFSSYHDLQIPQNLLGYAYAKDGKAYAGIFPFISNDIDNEFVQGRLSTSLQKDSVYCISFWLSHADSVHYYINAKHFGVWFIDYKSGYPPTVTLNDSLPFIQGKVAFVADTFFLDNDSGWTELKTTYKAKGGESYFIIGNFTPKNQLQTMYKQNGTSLNWYSIIAYYYLDEVSIYRCNDTLPPPIPKDTAYLALPNAFSPNGDGENDVFRVLGSQYVQSIELAVYNRWGQQVFYTNQKEQGWDGSFKGQKAPTGVYAYTLQATLPNGEVIHKKGNVTLKR